MINIHPSNLLGSLLSKIVHTLLYQQFVLFIDLLLDVKMPIFEFQKQI